MIKKKLHFGCFDQPHDGWINTDITPHIWISKIPFLPIILLKLGKISQLRFEQHKKNIFKKIRKLDITKRFPFKNCEFGYAFSSHVLEHLYYNQAFFCISEVYRILTPGGIIRLAVPNLDRCIKEYDPTNPDDFCLKMYESRQMYDKNRHHWMYNEYSLKKLLLKVGFSDIYRCQYRQGKCPDVEKIDNRPDSLFMEAIKHKSHLIIR